MTDGEFEFNIEDDKKNILSTGNPEIDKKLADGLPLSSLNLIEGANDTGKSVMTQQIMWGGLNQGFNMAIYTTENTIKSFLNQMESLSLDISDHFGWGYLKIYPIHVDGVEWNADLTRNFLQRLINHIKTIDEEVIVIDSFTVFTMSSSQDDIFNFFAECKSQCDSGKTILITLHQYAFDEDTLIRIRSIADGHIKLRLEQVGDRYVSMMEVAKIRGAKKMTGNVVSFEVHPGYGLKIIPYSSAQV
ncbi:flagellar accessory protein FlaH [Methanocella sp. CWC-04]|uniref:Flagellar accessory protein FlaH n=1 Tax=Methanooceanicella nereidis TaxID=2052831 RepID=A0AAP2RH00_9EURY|nr:ATPase domain-containing protein [Methanocella sp. CWC-04]MCD1296042.1 flagellar accessory protein FlaH [Methanocella sp. CWC-04]